MVAFNICHWTVPLHRTTTDWWKYKGRVFFATPSYDLAGNITRCLLIIAAVPAQCTLFFNLLAPWVVGRLFFQSTDDRRIHISLSLICLLIIFSYCSFYVCGVRDWVVFRPQPGFPAPTEPSLTHQSATTFSYYSIFRLLVSFDP